VAKGVQVSLGLLAVLLAAGSLAVSVAIFFVVLRVLQSTRREARSGDERLEILREQRDRLAFMSEERSQFLEELERRRKAIADLEHQRQIERQSEIAAISQREESRSWWRRMFGS
jgi:biopolymer transport protein ExbB/TolQ